MVRVFFAVELPEEVRQRLRGEAESLTDCLRGLRPTRLSNLHLTLRFLGPIPAIDVAELERGIRPRLESVRPFAVELAGLGAFPDPRRARVVWAGTEPSSRLEALAGTVRDVSRGMGAREERSFRGHVTIARTRSPEASDGFAAEIAARQWLRFGTIPVKSVVLLESRPTAMSGPEYRPVFAVAMEGRG